MTVAPKPTANHTPAGPESVIVATPPAFLEIPGVGDSGVHVIACPQLGMAAHCWPDDTLSTEQAVHDADFSQKASQASSAASVSALASLLA